jgi:hypothetical protein
MEARVESWDDIFRELRSEFARRATPGIERAGTLLDHLSADRSDPRLLSELRRELLDLAGDSGRYGAPAVTALAQEGERACSALLDRAQPPAAIDLDRWRALLSAIRTGLAS